MSGKRRPCRFFYAFETGWAKWTKACRGWLGGRGEGCESAGNMLAERGGFEPPSGYYPEHAFQACDLNHSSTSPRKRAHFSKDSRAVQRFLSALPSDKAYKRNVKSIRLNPKIDPYALNKWSGRRDSNSRPLAPHASALPGCATPRQAAHYR